MPPAPHLTTTVFRWLALICLVLAYGTGQRLKHATSEELIRTHFPEYAQAPVDWSEDARRLRLAGEQSPSGYLVTKTTTGWGGPLISAVRFTTDGEIKQVVVLAHKETPAFLRSLEREGFFEQFVGKKVRDVFLVGRGITAVSGATVSSKAFTQAVGHSAYDLGNNLLHLGIEMPPPPWQFGANECILIVLYAIIIVATLRKFTKFRKLILVFCIGFLGFHLGSPIAISNIGAMILGYFPPLRPQLFWYLLVMGSLLFILLWGRNLYCVWMCPFGAIQEIITTIAGIRIRVSRGVLRFTEHLVLFLLWVSLMIMFLTTTPALGMFEPFATLFSLKGSGVQWYLVSVSIFAAFVIPRFWCRFFCPVGAFFKTVIKTRKKIIHALTRRPNGKTEQ